MKTFKNAPAIVGLRRSPCSSWLLPESRFRGARQGLIVAAVTIGWFMLASVTSAQPELIGPRTTTPENTPTHGTPDEIPQVASKLEVLGQAPTDNRLHQFNQLITHVVRDNIPHTFQETKDWNKTAQRWDGLEIHREGLRIKTKRKRKEVNHGDWQMYTCELIDPSREFAVAISNIRAGDDGRTHFDVDVDALLKLHGRVARWVKGVQLFSIGADANARVRLQLSFAAATQIELNHLPPDVLIDLEVTQANIELDELDLIRVGKLGGEPADQIGRGMKHVLENKLEEKRPKLVDKLNRAIDKRQDELRLSLHDALEDEWREWSKPPQPVLEPGETADQLKLNAPRSDQR